MLAIRWLALAAAAAALLFFGLFARAASTTPRVRPFDAQFKDTPCGTLPAGKQKLCGSGTVTHFGAVKSVVVLGRPVAGPAPGCVIYRGTRTLTLAKHRHTKLRLAIDGPACGSRAWGSFKIVTGTGVFSKAKGSGVIWGTPLQLRYFGVITLPK